MFAQVLCQSLKSDKVVPSHTVSRLHTTSRSDTLTWALPCGAAQECSMSCVWHWQLLETTAHFTPQISPHFTTNFNLSPTNPLSYITIHLFAPVSAFSVLTRPQRWLFFLLFIPGWGVIYRVRCPHTNCGILSVSSHSVWWWQTPGGLPQTWASCSTLSTQATSRRPAVSQITWGRLSVLHRLSCASEAPPCGEILKHDTGDGSYWTPRIPSRKGCGLLS